MSKDGSRDVPSEVPSQDRQAARRHRGATAQLPEGVIPAPVDEIDDLFRRRFRQRDVELIMKRRYGRGFRAVIRERWRLAASALSPAPIDARRPAQRADTIIVEKGHSGSSESASEQVSMSSRTSKNMLGAGDPTSPQDASDIEKKRFDALEKKVEELHLDNLRTWFLVFILYQRLGIQEPNPPE